MHSLSPSVALADEPIRAASGPDVVELYWVDNVAIMAWRRPPTADVVEELHRAAEPQRRKYPNGMSFVHMGRVQLAMMDAATRHVFVRVLQELDGYVAATAIVSPASGFWASTLRSIATGIVVLARSQVDIRFHDRPVELLEWLPERHEERTGVKLDPQRLLSVLVHAAASLEGAPPVLSSEPPLA